MKVLFLLPSLGYNRAAKQAVLLARGLRPTCEVRVCVLQPCGDRFSTGPLGQVGNSPPHGPHCGLWAEDLRQACIPVQSLSWTCPVDPTPLWQLYGLLREYQPDRIFLWKMPCLRTLALVGRSFLRRTIASQVLSLRQTKPHLNRLDHWLLERVAKVVAAGQYEADTLCRLGVAAGRIAVITPGVEMAADAGDCPGAGSRTLVCVGPLEAHKGIRSAIWALDFLAFVFPDLKLILVGSCSQQSQLAHFLQARAHGVRCVEFLGERPDVAGLLTRAEVCLVPSLTPTGTQSVLDALAAGCPVVGSDLPHLRELFDDGIHGFLVPPGDALALARRTRPFLLDPDLRRRCGHAAQERARSRFSAVAFLQNSRRLLN